MNDCMNEIKNMAEALLVMKSNHKKYAPKLKQIQNLFQ